MEIVEDGAIGSFVKKRGIRMRMYREEKNCVGCNVGEGPTRIME